MADRTIGSLPAAASIEDDSLLVAEQQGEAVHFTGKQLKDYAKAGLDALVAQAKTAAEAADKAATDAEAAAKTAAEKAAAVTDDAKAAAQAAKTATEAQAAAQTAREAAEAAKTAAEQAASAAAQAAAETAAEAVRSTLEGYLTDAEAARDAAEAAAQNAAGAVVGALSGYVRQAEQAKNDAQSAAQTAADDAVAEATQQVAGYVAAAEAAKTAAETARDQAREFTGDGFMPKNVYDPQGKARDIFDYVDEMLGSAGAQVAKATLPKGRMRGDVDGDGEVTHADRIAILEHLTQDPEHIITDEIALWCADVTTDGNIRTGDATQIGKYANADPANPSTLTSKPYMADYYGTWTYVMVDSASGYFYTDMAVEGVTAACSAIVAVQGDHKRDAFAGAECMDGFVRVKANILPVADAVCLVFYSPGDGTAVVVPENVIERTGAPLELELASSTNNSTKIFGLTITDDGAMTATDGDGNAYPIGEGKVKTVNGQEPDENGNIEVSVEDEIFIAEYEVTAIADIVAAYNAGKAVFCRNGNFLYTIVISGGAICSFVRFSGTRIEVAVVTKMAGWSTQQYDAIFTNIDATMTAALTLSGGLILPSSTEGSAKKFKLTVDDSGTITATEVTT